jgi:hypothetical protein
MQFKKEIVTKVEIDSFYIEGKIDLDADYFIKKIEEGIIDSPQNNTTNVKGFMTPWDYFVRDEEFAKIFVKIINQVENHSTVKNVLPSDWELNECWGLKNILGCQTIRHHHHPAVISGAIYLNESNQELIFDQIDTKLKPEKGSFALFSSHLFHKTERNLSNLPKYGLAFNAYEKNKYRTKD